MDYLLQISGKVGASIIFALALILGLNGSVLGQKPEKLSGTKPLTIHGNAGFNLIGYHISGIEDRMPPWTTVFSAQATANVYGIAIPFTIRYSGRQTVFMQPFNQFGMSPKYRWATAHIGYRSLRWSDFTLAGHAFLGAGIELNPGKLRFGYVYGRFRSSNEEVVFGPDTLRNFTRKGFAMKLGVGSTKNYLDLIMLRIQDDTASLSTVQNRVHTPAEQNGVMGFNSRVTLAKSLTWDTELAASFYTTDVEAPGFESVGNIPAWDFANRLLVINQSSEFLTALRSALNFRLKTTALRLEYRRIDPGYRSMGAYYLTNDIEQVTLAPSFSLFKRKLLIRGSGGVQRDNLRNTKKATSVRAISSFNASYNPLPKFGVDVSYSNYTNNQRAGRLPLIDSLKQYHTTANFSIMPRLIITKEKHQHLIMLIINRMELNDHNEKTALFTENRALTMQGNYHLQFTEHAITCMAGLTHNRLTTEMAEFGATGLSLGVNEAFLDGKISTGWNGAVVLNHGELQKGWVFNHGFNSMYQINKRHALRLNIYIINALYKDEVVSPSFNEMKGDFGYAYTF
jgi:hypothetical protein